MPLKSPTLLSIYRRQIRFLGFSYCIIKNRVKISSPFKWRQIVNKRRVFLLVIINAVFVTLVVCYKYQYNGHKSKLILWSHCLRIWHLYRLLSSETKGAICQRPSTMIYVWAKALKNLFTLNSEIEHIFS